LVPQKPGVTRLKQVPAPGPLGPDRFGATLDDSLPFRLSIAASRVAFTTGHLHRGESAFLVRSLAMSALAAAWVSCGVGAGPVNVPVAIMREVEARFDDLFAPALPTGQLGRSS
jgi:hypothetical protein